MKIFTHISHKIGEKKKTGNARFYALIQFDLGPVYMEVGDPRFGEVTRLSI